LILIWLLCGLLSSVNGYALGTSGSISDLSCLI
jgi:hypothetical protein